MTLLNLLEGVLTRARRGPESLLWLAAPLGAASLLVPAPFNPWLGLVALLAGLPWFFQTGRATRDTLLAIPRLFVSLLLTGFLLGFFAIVTLLATALGALAVMAGTGFDFDTASAGSQAWDAALASYRATPGWQMVQVVSAVAAFVFLIAVARSLPVLAASVREKRIVAMEAFNWTRGHGVHLLLASLGCIVLPLAVGLWLASSLSSGLSLLIAAPLVAAATYGLCSLSDATYARFRGQDPSFDTNS